MIKKYIAKKIIISRPLSFFYGAASLKVFLKIPIEKLDMIVQKWAISQFNSFSREDWDEVQLKKLKRMLCHAGKNVPYWRELFKRIKFDPQKLKSFEDIKKIPVMTRTEFKKTPSDHLFAENISKNRSFTAYTSGSTGEPLTLYRDKMLDLRRHVSIVYGLQSIGANTKEPTLIVGLPSHYELSSMGPRVDLIEMEIEEKRLHKIYPMIQSLKPKLIISTPSYLERFLFLCKKDKFNLSVERICYMGEPMSDQVKKDLTSFFQSKVYSMFGTREISWVCFECKNSSFHLNPWINYIEIVNGELVVSLFENDFMPFIRYATGDKGEILERMCECGVTSKLINIQGRSIGTVELPDGSAYHVQYISQYFASNFSQAIARFQLEQISINKLELRYVLNNEDEQLKTEERLRSYFKSIFSNQIEVVLVRMDAILPNKIGKIPVFIKNSK